jgi:signal recognition particle subunit SRP54
MKKMGGMGALMQMMPGISKMAGQLEAHGVDDTMLKRQEAIILSMTKAEREKPVLLNASRKKRIAAGSGTSVQEINRLVKQQQQMQTVLKRMRKMGMGKMMGMMKGMMGEKDAEMLSQSMDPEALASDMAEVQNKGPLGPNPFDDMGKGPKGLPPGLGGGLPGLGGAPAGGFSAAGGGRRKKKKR